MIFWYPMPGFSKMIIQTNGYFTIAPFVHGFNKTEDVYPGYRSEFLAHVDISSYRSIIFSIDLGNTTMIDRFQGQMKMDRIRYLLVPGLRLIYMNHLIRLALNHECIHNISRTEVKGSSWWNSLVFGLGSKGSYYLYLPAQFKKARNTFIHDLDYQINIGKVIPAKNTIFTGKNHDYNYEFYYLLRYQIGVFRNFAYFASFRHHLWLKQSGSYDDQMEISLNMLLKGQYSFSGFFYSYRIRDTFILDSAEGLGSIGLKVIF